MVPDAENLTDSNCDTIDLGVDNINCSYPLLLNPNETRLGVILIVRAAINCAKRDKLLETAGDPDKRDQSDLELLPKDVAVRD